MKLKIQKNLNLNLSQIKQTNNRFLKIIMMKTGLQMKIIIVKVHLKILKKRKIKINKFNKNLAANITLENVKKNVQNAMNSFHVDYAMI